MDRDTRNRIQRATQAARQLVEHEYANQLEGVFDIRLDGTLAADPGDHLDATQRVLRAKMVAAVEHLRAGGMTKAEAVSTYLRESAFTTLNRFVALKMLEAREFVQECVSRGDQSMGFKEFAGLAPGLLQLPDSGYRLYIESLFDEIGREVRILFDRHHPNSSLWPRRQALFDLLAILNAPEIAPTWGKDETIGWTYQYFNSDHDRQRARYDDNGKAIAPRSSADLAIRNQFFTPRYVVKFLVDNTLGRIWFEMMRGDTHLRALDYRVRQSPEVQLTDLASATEEPTGYGSDDVPFSVPYRRKKDPRDLRVLDPACGSGHFLLYSFDLLLTIYQEAFDDPESSKSEATGRRLVDDYPSIEALRSAIPGLILAHNLHGVDIDARCVQIAQLALWMRVQSAYQSFDIRRSKRPAIRHSNIVVAEQIVADQKTVSNFLGRMDDVELKRVFAALIDSLKMASELGLLLRIEALVRRSASLTRSADLFAPEKEQLHAALLEFLDQYTSLPKTRVRLFAEDAAQGIGLFAIADHRYDALLMNPPFGEATPEAAKYLESTYPQTRLDLFAVFCERLLELAQPDGLIGAITPRDGFFKKTLSGWRDIVQNHRLSVVADLGIGVLDAATVRVAAYVIDCQPSSRLSRFIGIVDVPDRDRQLLIELKSPKRCFDVDVAMFKKLPLGRFLYWLPPRLWDLYGSSRSLENISCTPRYGLTTLNDERFCRLFFELSPETIGETKSWAFMSKGGDDFPFGGVSNSVVLWRDDGAEMAEVNRQSNGQVAQTRRASRYYFRPAVSFSNRSVQFSVRWHPANYLFSVRGPVVVPLSASPAYLLGFFNSRLIRALIQMQTASQTYTSGVLKELRWVEPDAQTRQRLEHIAATAFDACREHLGTVETDPCFAGIVPHRLAPTVRTWADYQEWRESSAQKLNDILARCQSQIDDQVATLYGVTTSDIERCERSEDIAVESVEFPSPFRFSDSPEVALGSFLIGHAFGRWKARPVVFVPSITTAAPERQPAASTGPFRSVLVDDEGHPDDIGSAVSVALRNALREMAPDEDVHLEEALGTGSLRTWYALVFFGKHLRTYSGFGRKAPIYWQLTTATASYSIWLYIHACSSDTLFRVLNDYVTPKLLYEERRLTSLTIDLDSSPAARRKQLVAQERLVEELRTFLEELKRVASLWNPNLDDGVAINFAPLWRLVPHHRAWQKYCRATWEKLCSGRCDWAHLAMHLWPERVVPKCATDLSLAIAHGLVDAFWHEGSDGQWQPRKFGQVEIDKLVRERSSAAVKDALSNLLEAPVPVARRASLRKAPKARGTLKSMVSARPKTVSNSTSSNLRHSKAVDAVLLSGVKDAIRASASGATKTDVVGATGITASAWNKAIKALLADGSVTQTGQRRGVRYHLRGRDV